MSYPNIFPWFSPRFFPWFFPWPVVAPLGGRDDASAGRCDAGGLGRGLGLDHQVPLGARAGGFGGGGGGGGLGGWGLGGMGRGGLGPGMGMGMGDGGWGVGMDFSSDFYPFYDDWSGFFNGSVGGCCWNGPCGWNDGGLWPSGLIEIPRPVRAMNLKYHPYIIQYYPMLNPHIYIYTHIQYS